MQGERGDAARTGLDGEARASRGGRGKRPFPYGQAADAPAWEDAAEGTHRGWGIAGVGRVRLRGLPQERRLQRVLLEQAEATGRCPRALLEELAAERLLLALGRSRARDRFPLHGARCMGAWFQEMPRLTRGLDLLDLRSAAPAALAGQLRALTEGGRAGSLPLLEWDAARIASREMRARHLHRIAVPARLGSWRADLRISVIQAERPAPPAEVRYLPSALPGGERPLVACCIAEEVVAEKAALMVTYGAGHTRLQDVLDLCIVARRATLDGGILAARLRAVFQGRDADLMLARGDGYWEAAFCPSRVTRAARLRWEALCEEVQPTGSAPGLDQALRMAAGMLMPVLSCLRRGDPFRRAWLPAPGMRWRDRLPPGRRVEPSLLAWEQAAAAGSQAQAVRAC